MIDYDAPGVAGLTSFAALIVAEGWSAGAAESAVAAAGGRVQGLVGWRDAVAEIEGLASQPILVLETAGVSPDILLEVLPVVTALAEERYLPIVAAIDAADIDLVAANLWQDGAQVLVDPSATDRVAALRIANHRPLLVSDTLNEGEAARLRKLSEEVARIADVIARISKDNERAELNDRRPDYIAEPAPAGFEVDPAEVRQRIRARRARDQYFGAGMFEDPAWDMLLDLYAAHLEHRRVSVSSLCIAAAVAPTTALRWIGKMTDSGLFERHPDPLDRRRAFMALSPKALQAMRGYFAATKRSN